METERTGCEARQYSDQMMCDHCGLAWDMNDPAPPECQRQGVRDGSEVSDFELKALRQRAEEREAEVEVAVGQQYRVPPSISEPIGVTVTRKVETAELGVERLDGPLLEMAFYEALTRAGIRGFVYRNRESFRELQVVIEDDPAPATPPLAGQYAAARFGVIRCHGDSPFIAAARCFVKSVYGPTVIVRMAG